MTNIDQQVGTSEQIEDNTETSAETQTQVIAKTFTQEEVDGIVKTRLNKVNKKYEGINLSEYKTLKEEKEDLKSQILIHIKTHDVNKHVSKDNIILTHKSVSRKTFDKPKIEEYCAQNDINLSEFQKESETERLTIKQIEEE